MHPIHPSGAVGPIRQAQIQTHKSNNKTAARQWEGLGHGWSGRITGPVSKGTVEIQGFFLGLYLLPATNPTMALSLGACVCLFPSSLPGDWRYPGRWRQVGLGTSWSGNFVVLDWHIGKGQDTKIPRYCTPAAPAWSPLLEARWYGAVIIRWMRAVKSSAGWTALPHHASFPSLYVGYNVQCRSLLTANSSSRPEPSASRQEVSSVPDTRPSMYHRLHSTPWALPLPVRANQLKRQAACPSTHSP